MADGTNGKFDTHQAVAVYNALVRQDYVNDEGTLTARYFDDKRNGSLDFGKSNDMKDSIIAILDTVFTRSIVKPEDGRKPKLAKFQRITLPRRNFRSYGSVSTAVPTIR